MRTIQWANCTENERKLILQRPNLDAGSRKTAIETIIAAVRERGDEALREFTERFDKCRIEEFRVSAKLLEESLLNVSHETRTALQTAHDNIELFHRAQLRSPYQIETRQGSRLTQEIRPIRRVGLYIPGGSAALISTVLMLAVPARLAGCREIVLCTPPRPDGSIDPHLLAVAQLCGLTQIYRIGGAQAIAAMAYGTESIPKVDKIFGPGSSWVTDAKLLVSQDPEGASIDIPAGPSELMVVADASSHPRIVASDLLSQAEHGDDSQVILLSFDGKLIQDVMTEIASLIKRLSRAQIILNSLEHALFIQVADESEALEIIQDYAPEHLILQVFSPSHWIPKIANAGSIFCGAWTPESAGDYASGTNHVLPTGGWARSMSGVSVDSFQRTMCVQTLTAEGLMSLGATIETLARLEGLDAHALAVEVRRNFIEAREVTR